MASHIAGKTVIVTGAGGGLGKVIAETFLSSGANVVICDVSPTRLAAVSTEWSTAGHEGKFLTTQTDVTDEAAVTQLVATAVQKFGRLDVLVNNAGVMDDFSPVGDCSKEMWDRVLAINLNGPYLTSRAALKHFEKAYPTPPTPAQGPGLVIINIGSQSSIQGFLAGAAYTASKAGLMGLTKNTAGYYGAKGVSCVALLLGGMATNIADAFAKGMHMEMYQQIKKVHPYDPATALLPLTSVGKYCVFLADPEVAPTANGSCISFNKNLPVA